MKQKPVLEIGTYPAYAEQLRVNGALTPGEMASMLVWNGREPIPENLLRYLVRFLRDPRNFKKQSGRKQKIDPHEITLFDDIGPAMIYERALEEYRAADREQRRQAKLRKEALPKAE